MQTPSAAKLQVFHEADETSVHQHLVVLRHGARLQPSNPNWIKISEKTPWDMPLAPGYAKECQTKATQLQGIKFSLIAISPFLRCAQTASELTRHLDLDSSCRIFFHRGLSEVHSIENLFPRTASPSICQRFAFWRWRSKRDQVLPDYSVLGNVQVQQKVLGSWPAVPETVSQAQRRYQAVMMELLEMAQEGNVLLITHAEGVEQLVHWLRPGAIIQDVDYLGHAEALRLLRHEEEEEHGQEAMRSASQIRVREREGKEERSWQLVQPPEDLCGQKAVCGVALVPERMSEARHSKKWQGGRLHEAAMDDKMRLALCSNSWWAMTD